MEREAERHLDQILATLEQHFTDIQVKEYDVSASRALLQVVCAFGDMQIAVTEVIAPTVRKYSYYLRRGSAVLLGLDNAKDHSALRLKYGKNFTHHVQERVPHLHGKNKQTVELTGEKTVEDFVRMVLEFKERP